MQSRFRGVSRAAIVAFTVTVPLAKGADAPTQPKQTAKGAAMEDEGSDLDETPMRGSGKSKGGDAEEATIWNKSPKAVHDANGAYRSVGLASFEGIEEP